MNVTTIACNLQQWGYLNENINPEALDEHDGDFVDAVSRWQSRYAYILDEAVHRWHGRALVPNGEIGLASLELLNTPRCGCRDPQPGDAIEEANWPDACRQDITTWWDLTGLNIDSDTSRREMAAAYDSWFQRVVLQFRRVGSAAEARIYSGVASLSGSTLAWSYLAQNNCGARLEQRYNSRVDWKRDNSEYLRRVGAHEIGHALGLQHINSTAALMNPYITAIAVPQRLDLAAMQRAGYTLRTETPPPPPPPPAPPPLPGDELDTIVITTTSGKSTKYKLVKKEF